MVYDGMVDPNDRWKICNWRMVSGDDFPEVFQAGIIYLIGAPDPWAVGFQCPCGCGVPVLLSLIKDTRPRWRVDTQTVSITPSVSRITGCRSHFFITNGQTVWC